MTGRKAVCKELFKVYLSAGRGEGIEIKVMNVDIALAVSLCVLRVENIHLIILLGGNASVLEHCTHCSIAVDICILALDIAVLC